MRCRRAAGLLLLAILACETSGEVVVVLDSTMRGEGVEVIAYRHDDASAGAPGDANRRNAAGPRRAPTALEDSALTVGERFRALRDSLNDEVSRLGELDRRSRAYAVRYAEIRRRTLAAEQLRARRDSLRLRATSIAARSDADASWTRVADAAPESLPLLTDLVGVQRRAATDSIMRLDLAPGRWYIGVARNGRLVSPPTEHVIGSGDADTLRIGGPARPSTRAP